MNFILFKGKIGRLGFLVGVVVLVIAVIRSVHMIDRYKASSIYIVLIIIIANFIYSVLVVKRLNDLNLPRNYYWKLWITSWEGIKLYRKLFFIKSTVDR
jgi:uncharacterized membrane protein YhaH (DUF805 family)